MSTSLLKKLPKAELHLHIEGTLEPQMMWDFAQKHHVNLSFDSVDEIAQAYHFDNLQSFLDLYYQGAGVLLVEDDYYQLMWAYLLKCKQDNVVHTEIMFDPQTHTERGIGFDVFMPGFVQAIKQAKDELGVSVYLIMSFLRHLSEESAFETLDLAKPYYTDICAVGLDSSELGHPPSKFEKVFAKARSLGFKVVAHAGEEGPPAYIWEAIELLKVDRIDHGVRCIEDQQLVAYLIEKQIPLTVCPLSNLKLKVFESMSDHNILKLLNEGLVVTVNADDPSYFGGYLNDNFTCLSEALKMTNEQQIQLCKNSIIASFLPQTSKDTYIREIDNLAATLKSE